METVVHDLCDGTAGDWNVQVVAANIARGTVGERCGEVTSCAPPRSARRTPCRSVRRCRSHLWRHRADCVVLHEPNPIAGTALFLAHAGAAARRLASQRSRAAVVGAGDLRPRLQRALYRRADCVIVSSPAARRAVRARPAREARGRDSVRHRARSVPSSVDDRAARAGRARSRRRPRDRASCSSAGSCTTRASTCCSTRWGAAPARW